MKPQPSTLPCLAWLPTDDTLWRRDCVLPRGHHGDHQASNGDRWRMVNTPGRRTEP